MREAGEDAESEQRRARRWLDLAARAAWRGWGRVEPNPLVGCVLVRNGVAIAVGHHRVYGGLHAEREALESLRRRGVSSQARGATAYVTLEPCNGAGKQPACVGALIEAGVERVVYAAADDTPGKGGGAAALRAAGVAVEFSRASAAAARLSEPWRWRLTSGLPWVIGKWAQSIDGRVAAGAGGAASGESRWISGERSRRLVHLTRSRVDAVLTGIGTVLRDDPLLTARPGGERLARRRPLRVVLDPRLELPAASRLLASARAGDGQVLVVATPGALERWPDRARAIERGGGAVVPVASVADAEGRVDLRELLALLLREHRVWTVMTEAGPRVLGALLAAGVMNEMHVYTGPLLLGPNGLASVAGIGGDVPAAARRAALVASLRRGDDVLSVYRWG